MKKTTRFVGLDVNRVQISETVKAIGWRAQHRLHERYWKLTARGKALGDHDAPICPIAMGEIRSRVNIVVNLSKKSRAVHDRRVQSKFDWLAHLAAHHRVQLRDMHNDDLVRGDEPGSNPVERFFRSLEEECVWQHNFSDFADARVAVSRWIDW